MWTTTKPTEPGYYWYWNEAVGLGIVLICKRSEDLIVWSHGLAQFSHLRGLLDTTKWAGPIEEPKESNENINP